MSLAQTKLDVRNYLEEKDSKLQCTDFKGRVIILHQDGSKFELENAIMEETKEGDFYKFQFVLVWTEHCGNFYFFIEDLEKWEFIPYKTETA